MVFHIFHSSEAETSNDRVTVVRRENLPNCRHSYETLGISQFTSRVQQFMMDFTCTNALAPVLA